MLRINSSVTMIECSITRHFWSSSADRVDTKFLIVCSFVHVVSHRLHSGLWWNEIASSCLLQIPPKFYLPSIERATVNNQGEMVSIIQPPTSMSGDAHLCRHLTHGYSTVHIPQVRNWRVESRDGIWGGSPPKCPENFPQGMSHIHRAAFGSLTLGKSGQSEETDMFDTIEDAINAFSFSYQPIT
jgi:hypothetical protein